MKVAMLLVGSPLLVSTCPMIGAEPPPDSYPGLKVLSAWTSTAPPTRALLDNVAKAILDAGDDDPICVKLPRDLSMVCGDSPPARSWCPGLAAPTLVEESKGCPE